ncbi:MAG: carbohydrate kinase [Bacteroidaceae bacterium]|nr:carbohydrate kinase [Bacteroidaceae bacterium]
MKVVGIGETILDLLFKNKQPVAAVPGGSSFNSIISVGRAGVPCVFVGYTGADIVGRQTIDFMQKNGVSTEYFKVIEDEKSAISLAFLNDKGDANYVFYKQPPFTPKGWKAPTLSANDVLLLSSYYAVCKGTRPMITQLLKEANKTGAIVYYDLNFRRGHAHELEALMPAILSNFSQSNIVRGSADDFEIMYGTREASLIYQQHIQAHCPIFICTAGPGKIEVCTPAKNYQFQAPLIEDVVSTVGAGDSFNAGFSCALIWQGITKDMLPCLSEEQWKQLVGTACLFSADTCRSTQNYISPEFKIRP